MSQTSVFRYVVCMTILIGASTALALIQTSTGNDPVEDRNWPVGSVDVANLKTRVGWWEGPPFGGGQYQFLFRGTIADFQVALDSFASIDAPKRLLVVYQGPGENQFLGIGQKGADTHVDWDFTVWDPRSWNQLYNDPRSTFMANDPNGGFRQPVPPPTLHVYVAGQGVTGIDFTQVFVPPGVMVQDTRATSAGYKATDASVIRGRVCEMGDPKPLVGAEVVVGSRTQNGFAKVASATTEADGRFEMLHMAAGGYALRASAKGYAPRDLGYCRLTKDSLEEVSVLLSPAVAISGTAVDTAGKPLPGVKVSADNVIGSDGKGYPASGAHEATTDAAGRFEITDLPKGDIWFRAADNSLVLVEPLKRYAVPSEGIMLQLTGTGTIKGKLISKGGAGAGGRTIHVAPDGGEKVGKWSGGANVNPDGSFEFSMVPPGRYTVSGDAGASVTGRPDPSAKTIEVKAGDVVEVTVEGSGRW